MLRYGSALSVAPPKQSNPNPMPIGDGFGFISTFTSGEIGINSTMLNGAEIMIPRSISINNCFVLNHAFGITVIHRIDLIT